MISILFNVTISVTIFGKKRFNKLILVPQLSDQFDYYFYSSFPHWFGVTVAVVAAEETILFRARYSTLSWLRLQC